MRGKNHMKILVRIALASKENKSVVLSKEEVQELAEILDKLADIIFDI